MRPVESPRARPRHRRSRVHRLAPRRRADRARRRGDGPRRPLDRAPGVRERGRSFVEHDIREPFGRTPSSCSTSPPRRTSARRSSDRHSTRGERRRNGQRPRGGAGLRAAVVFASTGGAIYGDVDGPAGEDAALRPVSPYGTAKLAAEAYIEAWRRIHGLRSASLRFANVYGPRQSASLEGGVIAIFLERMAGRRGDGGLRRRRADAGLRPRRRCRRCAARRSGPGRRHVQRRDGHRDERQPAARALSRRRG